MTDKLTSDPLPDDISDDDRPLLFDVLNEHRQNAARIKQEHAELVEALKSALGLINMDRLHSNDEWIVRDADELIAKVEKSDG